MVMPTIKIKPVTRIESHGSLTIKVDEQGTPVQAFFSTPVLRGFEAFLQGTPIERVPWLASRICGVCPVPHSVNASRTLEKAIKMEITDTAKILREMLVLSQLIDSHALSFVMLSLPDLFPAENIHSINDVRQHSPDLFAKGLRLHSLGRQLTSLLGGRNVHPTNVRVGGMSTNPLLTTSLELPAMIKETIKITQEFLQYCKEWFAQKTDLIKSLGAISSYYMALSDEGSVSFVNGEIKVTGPNGSNYTIFQPDNYLSVLSETTQSHTYMKLPFLKELGSEEGILRVNCLARANVNEQYGTPIANQELRELRASWGKPLEYSLLSHWARLIEIIYACERLEELLVNSASQNDKTAVTADIIDGEAVNCLEAPRGTLFHHYALQGGCVTHANLLVATQNNGLAVNKALSETVKASKIENIGQEELVHRCEMVIRAYDPCISCATHVIQIKKMEETE
ncbi:MAG: hypothetical protein GF308_08030 [Candidatus Heimdallarchaeota archaeon]|nr:hypothetical protein [Candidatus Heimdallarchaeota archaeon]